MSVSETAIITERFAVSPSEYVGRVTGAWLGHWGWLLIIPFGICGVLSFYRWEWLVVALALLLIVFPFILAMVYFVYGMSPAGVNAIRPRKVELTAMGPLIHYYKKSDEDYIADGLCQYEWTDIKEVENSSKGMTVKLRATRYDHIFIPETAFGEIKKSFVDFMKENGTMFV